MTVAKVDWKMTKEMHEEVNDMYTLSMSEFTDRWYFYGAILPVNELREQFCYWKKSAGAWMRNGNVTQGKRNKAACYRRAAYANIMANDYHRELLKRGK